MASVPRQGEIWWAKAEQNAAAGVGGDPLGGVSVLGGIDPDRLGQLDPIYRSLDAAIARAASASRARVAEALPVFNPSGNLPSHRANPCALTFICSKGDPRPTDAGYRALPDTFVNGSGHAQR